VDILGIIADIKTADLVVFFVLFGMFILGFTQGIIRRLVGIATILLSLIVAAQLQAQLGSFLAANWTQYNPEYNRMLAFGVLFLVGAIGAAIATQVFFKPVPLFARYKVVDEVLGGLLGVVQGALIIAAFYVITDPFFNLGGDAHANEFPFVRQIHEALQGSVTADLVRTRLVPLLLVFVGGLMPEAVREAFRS